nr:hypothetical protein [uncultured Brevundimonas sp.]
MNLKFLRALVVMAAALTVLVFAIAVWFQGFRFNGDVVFVVMFAICLLAANLAYDWLSKRSINRIAAYSSAAIVLMICAFVLAELMTRLNIDNRASVYRWMAGLGMVTAVAWVAFDLMLRGRLDASDRWIKPTAFAAAILAVLVLLWAGFTVPVVRVVRVTADDCALMAQALKDFSPEGLAGGMRLEAKANCNWRCFGLPELGVDQGYPIGDFHPWFSVQPPTYSLFGTRAALSVGQEWVMLGGGGQTCFYTRTFEGWRKGRCEESWIS